MKKPLYAKMCEFMGYWLVIDRETKKHIKSFDMGADGKHEALRFIEEAQLHFCKDGHRYWRAE